LKPWRTKYKSNYKLLKDKNVNPATPLAGFFIGFCDENIFKNSMPFLDGFWFWPSTESVCGNGC